MGAAQIAGFAVCAAALALILRRLRPESATVLVIAASALAGLMILPQLAQIVDGVVSLAKSGGVQDGYITQLLKISGISLLMDFAAQTCRDAGETGIAAHTELAGRILILTLTLPSMHRLMELILSVSA